MLGQRLDERPDTAVILAKGVLDLRQNMRLVNDHAAHMRGGKCGAHILAAELLRRKVEETAVRGKVAQNGGVSERVEQSGAHASALERLHLIALQRAQGRENKRERTRLIEQCGQMIQQRLSAAGAQPNEDITSGKNRRQCTFLFIAQMFDTECLQCRIYILIIHYCPPRCHPEQLECGNS